MNRRFRRKLEQRLRDRDAGWYSQRRPLAEYPRGYDPDFDPQGQGQYVRDFSFSEAYDEPYDPRGFDRELRPDGPGQYNRDFTYNQAYDRSSARRSLRPEGYGQYERSFTFNRSYNQPELNEDVATDNRLTPLDRSIGRSLYGRRSRVARIGPDTEFGRSARQVAYPSGPHQGAGPKNYLPRDERIQERACDRLTRHGSLDARGIQIKVEDGIVTLTGQVDSRRSKRLAEDMVEKIPGVRDVMNKLKIQ